MPYADHTVARGKASGSTTLRVPIETTPTSSMMIATRATRRDARVPRASVIVATM